MASSGDPSAFTFTMDAFPDYTRFNPTKKVLASIQIVTEGTSDSKVVRESTYAALAGHYENSDGIIVDGNTNFTEAIANNTIVIDGVEYELTKKIDEPEETGLG
jgi:hypothetical protein